MASKNCTRKKKTEEQRFMNFVYPVTESGCWLFMGALDQHGYSFFRRSPEKGYTWTRAHRVSYSLFIGDIPTNKVIDHLCRVRCCVNPAHLEAVTQKTNINRGLTGENFRKVTHCKKGHPYSGDNLYRRSNGCRDCKACRRERHLKYMEKKC